MIKFSIYHSQTKFAKVMFLHVSVILSMGRSAPRGVCLLLGGCLLQGGGSAPGGSALGVWRPPLPVTAAAEDGTPPTGMLSCLFIFRATQELKVMKANEAYFIDVISRVLFPFLFAIFNVIYWSYYLTRY